LKKILIILLFQVFTYSAFAETLRIATEQWVPYVVEEETDWYGGMDIDILNALAQSMNMKIKYIPCKWKRCLALIKAGEADVLSHVSFRKKRTKFAK
jgi:polar amino acid transport system substrate-binding protein